MKMKRTLVAIVALALCAPVHATRYPSGPAIDKAKRIWAMRCFISSFFGRKCAPFTPFGGEPK